MISNIRGVVLAMIAAVAVAGCQSNGMVFPNFPETKAGVGGGVESGLPMIPPPVIRQPVLPEYLVGCRGHVLVPALGMTFVRKGTEAPLSGQYLREERVTAPYRIIRPGDRLSQDRSMQRLNVELDNYDRVVGLACG